MTGRGEDVLWSGDHPDPGLIAAHAERRLSGEEAARLDGHIAGCSSCHEVFAETLRFALDDKDAGEAGPAPLRPLIHFAQRPAFRLAAALVVAAGAFVALAKVWRGRSERATPALVTELAQAMGPRRFVEPRLTGGFQHGRLVVLRSGEDSKGLDAHTPAVLAVVARIREQAEVDTSAEALGALGITYLVSGDVGAALNALESATGQDPGNPRLLSDLAAAYLVRATRLDQPADLPKALEAAERAVARPAPPAEAYFNRALALERLHLVDAARQAWNDYLQRDSTSGWAEEARRHREGLPQDRESSVEEDHSRVRAAVQEGANAVDRLAADNPSLLRDFFQDELLPSWADAYLTRRSEEARLRSEALLLGDALLRATGDALPGDTARALIAPAATVGADPLRAQAQGFRELRKAQRLRDGMEPSCAPHRAALRELEAGGSPRAAWARLQVVITCLFTADQSGAAAELARIEAIAAPLGYTQLLGRVQWMQGLILGERGRLTASLARYARARDSFVEMREPESEAGTLALMAQNLRLLGEDRRAWRDRERGLGLLGRLRNPRARHAILDEAVQACLAEQTPRSGLHFENALVTSALRSSASILASEALLRRAALHRALGSDALAMADLEESHRWMERVSDPRLAERLVAQAQATRGELLAGSRPEEAVQSLRESLAHFRGTAPQLVPSLQLLLARSLRNQGLPEAAETELLAGIVQLERQRTSLRDLALQISFFDQGLPLFDDMVRLQIERGEHERALAFVERARSRQLVDSLRRADGSGSHATVASTTPLDPKGLQRELQQGVTLLYYVPLEDRLLTWALSRTHSQFVQRGLPASRLRRLVARHRAALERSRSPELARETGALLYDELVRPLLPALATGKVLVIVPDGTLQTLAFASLVDRRTGRYFVEDHPLGVAPSGTVFVRASVAASAGPARHALVVGDPRFDPTLRLGLPDLPAAEAEAVEIAGLYDSADLLTGSRATKRAFLEALRGSEVVHYAGHSAAEPGQGSTGWLLLAPDGSPGDSGVLHLSDLAVGTMPRTRLVVLAACRTATGAISPAEGALSLGRPFLAAGVPSVVASLWDIDDRVSRRFFVAFHRALRVAGEPVVALRQAQLELLHGGDPADAHPASWAAFVCMGGLDRRRVAATATL